MVQPNYSPEEALHRVKLMMSYDSKKTLTENKQIIEEQTAGSVDPTLVGNTLAGAGIGATMAGGGIAAATAAGASFGSVFPVVGTAVGALAGLGLGMLASWASNHDKGEAGFRQLISACSAKGASRLVPKLSKSEIRQIAYSIEDAKGQWNDDEDAIVSALTKIPTVADLCAVDKKVSGGLAEFLDDLTDSPDEWKMFTRPLEGMIEDTEIVLTPEEQKKGGVSGGGKSGGKKSGGYKPCSGTYTYGCKTAPDGVIGKVQSCIGGLTPDGKFGPKTKKALADKGITSFTDADVTKICQTTTKPKDEFTTQVDADSVDDILNN
jgi:hypothetical protein